MRLLLIVAAICCAVELTVSDAQTGHFEDIRETYQTTERQCEPYTRESCSIDLFFFWLSTSCTTITSENCQNVLVTKERTIRRCKTGWQPEGACTVPICTPACDNEQVCKAPFPRTCECVGSGGGSCSFVACSDSKDCYPGTCGDGGNCVCPPEFGGPNCQTLNLKPAVKDCSVRIYAGSQPEVLVAHSQCFAEDVDPQVVWLSTKLPTKVYVDWRAELTSLSRLPRVNYVQNSPVPIGISYSTAVFNFPQIAFDRSTACVNNDDTPIITATCSASELWSNIGVGELQHGTTFNVSTRTRCGGQKTGAGRSVRGGGFSKRVFTGIDTLPKTTFKVDLKPPTHCMLDAARSANCSCFPIYINTDIRTTPVVEGYACDWDDDMSGIDRYHVEVYFMTSGVGNRLIETGGSVHSEDIRPPHYTFRFTCPKSGVYSIQLTVYDRANNSARAREIFNYDGDSKMTINSVPVVIAEADMTTSDVQWVNKLPVSPDGSNYTLTVVWTGRYQSDSKYADVFLREVEPWTPAGDKISCNPSTNCVDDEYENRFGFRTIHAVRGRTGIVGYVVSYAIDSSSDGSNLKTARESAAIPSTQERCTLNISKTALKDGDTIVYWLSVADATGNTEEIKKMVRVDRTPPKLDGEDFKTKTVDEFTSSLYVRTTDEQSGIKFINYTIYDVTLKVNVSSSSSAPLKYPMQHPNDRPKDRVARAAEKQCPPKGDDECYCIQAGGCYAKVQPVHIDNCLYDRYIKDPLEINYVVINQAGLVAKGSRKLTVEEVAEVHCRPPPGLSSGAWAALILFIIIPTVLLLIVSGLMIWRWNKGQDPLPPRLRTVYNRTVRHRNNDRSADNDLYVSGPAAKPNKLAEPMRAAPAKNVNADYGDEYAAASELSGGKFTAQQVETGKTLAEGRFAVVKQGTLCKGNENLPVAVKALKSGYSTQDRKLMEQKINFLAGVGANPNIVKFIGSYDGGDEGPVMLLERCDMTLKNWLSEHKNVTVDTLEDMLTFTLNIARGVEHLHSKRIIHRRLGVRNVLLKKQTSGYIAKLIGFGPSAEESSSGDKSSEVALPLKWFAPETLETVNSKNPTYNKKTDAWSFGITVWEIYSKGSKPYPEHDTKEIKGLLQRGHRMSRPSDCPPDLFESVVVPCWDAAPGRRPEFGAICSAIDKFRNAASDQQEGYYAAGEASHYANT